MLQFLNIRCIRRISNRFESNISFKLLKIIIDEIQFLLNL